MSIQTSKMQIILSQWDGLHTALDSDSIPDGRSPLLKNVRIAGSHFRGAKGYSLNGARNDTAGKITAKYTYTRNDGDEVMVQVRDDASTGTLEWYDSTNNKWYTLLASLTTGKTMGFTEFNYSTIDEDINQMIFCNGVENMSVWTGAVTRLTSAVTAGATSIPVSDTSNFPATGTIIYNGTEIAYTAKTATDFTVGSAHASDSTDDGVAEAVDDATYSSVTKGNILLSAENRLWIAGILASPLAFDFSDEGKALTYTGGANRADSGSETALNIGGKITGLAEKGDEIIILGPDGAEGFSFVYPTSTTKAPVYREIFKAKGKGCLNFKSVFKVGSEVYFANKNGIIALADVEGTNRIYDKSITRDILPTTKTYDFTDSASIYHDKEQILLVACKTDSTLPGNDVVIGVEFYRTAGGKDKNGNPIDGQDTYGITLLDWTTNCFSILADELYFGSSYEQNSFKGFDTYQNDGSPRTIRYATKRFNYGDPFQNKKNQFVGVRGMIKDGTDIKTRILYNSGFLGEKQKTISSTGIYVSQNTLNTIGAFEIGINPIGATIDDVAELKEFTVFLDIGVDHNPKDVQVIFESETDGGTFLITHCGFVIENVGILIEPNRIL